MNAALDVRQVLPPVFVGGTGRSGTNLVGHIIGRHSQYALIPHEVAFHAAPDADGLHDLVPGEIDLDRFLTLMREFWWRRTMRWDAAVERGLFKFVEPPTFDAALARLADHFAIDPVGASAQLMRDLLDPYAASQGKRSWVEMTPPNIAVAPVLWKMFPDAKFIHVVRDGRDVACSVQRLPWGPDTLKGGLRFWRDGIRDAESGGRALPAAQLLVIQLEDLVLANRAATYHRLLDFLELEDEPGVSEFFHSEVTPERAHIGRWRADLTMVDRMRASVLYHAVVLQLRSEGTRCLPRAVGRSVSHSGATGAEAGANIDPWADGRARDA